MGNMPSTAAQIIVTVIPIVGIMMGGAVILVYIILNYKQKNLMIERNMSDRNIFDLDSFSLFAGLLLFFIGLSLMIFYIIKEGISYGLLGGLIPLSVGIGLLMFFFLRIKVFAKRDDV